MFLVVELITLCALFGCCAVAFRSYGGRSLSFFSSILVAAYWLWFFGPLTNIVGSISPQSVENPSSGVNWNIYSPLFDKAGLMVSLSSVLALALLSIAPLFWGGFRRIASIQIPYARILDSVSLRLYGFWGTALLAYIAIHFGSIIGTQFFDYSELSAIDKSIVSSYFQVPAGPAIALGVLAVALKNRGGLALVALACFVNVICFVVFRQRLYCLISSLSLCLALSSLLGVWRLSGSRKTISLSVLLTSLLVFGYAAPTVLKGQFGPAGFVPSSSQIESHIGSLHQRFSRDFGYRLSGIGSASTALRVRDRLQSRQCLHDSRLSLLRGPLASELIGSFPLLARQNLGYEPSRLPEYLIGQCYGKDQVDLVETQALPFLLQFNGKAAIFWFSLWLCVSRLAISLLLWVSLRLLSVEAAGFLLIPLVYLGVVTGGLGEFMAFVKVFPVFLVLYALPSVLIGRFRPSHR